MNNKNTQARESIQELSGSLFSNLFYQKIREETEALLPSEKKLTDDEKFADDENVADKENIASEENLVSEENFADESNFAGDKKLLDNADFTGKENLTQNALPAKKILLAEALTNEENLASEENLTQNTLPAQNFSLAKNLYPPAFIANESPTVAEFMLGIEKNFASEENFASKIKESSSRFNLITTTTEKDSKENLASNKKIGSKISVTAEEKSAGEINIAGEGDLTGQKGNSTRDNSRRNVPVENYDAPLVRLASSMGMASFGMLVVLRSVLPQNGGVVRMNALARSIGMSANNVRLQLETLKNKGLIVTHIGGEEGRWVNFTDACLEATGNLFLASEENLPGNKNSIGEKNLAVGKGRIFVANRFTFPLRVKEFYFTCLRTGKVPESFQPAVVKAWIDAAEAEGSEYAVGALLEFLPNAKTNPSAYLHTMLENKVRPSGTSVDAAKQLFEALGGIGKTIGEEILPKDWVQTAGKLGIRVKTGSVQELTSQQAAVMTRLEKFTAQLQG